MKKFHLMLVLLVIVSMLAACAAPVAPTAAPAAPAATKAPAAPAAPAAATDTLTVAITTDPKSLDPRTIGGDYNFTVLAYISDRLLQFDMVQGKFVGVLATSWERLDDLTWQFKLRQGVKFSNGEPFNAEAVKFTLDNILDKSKAYLNASWVSDVKETKVVDEYTVNLITGIPSRSLPSNLRYLFIMPPKATATLGADFGAQPVGTGAYKVVKYVPNERIELTVNENYWGTKPTFKNLVVKFLPEDATRIAALKTGEVALIPNVSPDAIAGLKADPNLEVIAAPPARIMHLAFVYNRAPFNNIKLREAFNYAVNRQAIVDTVFLKLAAVANKHLFDPTTPGFNDQLKPFSYDPAKAKALLAEAGFPNGITVTFGCPNGRYLRDKMVCEALVSQFAEVGIKAELTVLEWGAYSESAINKNVYDMFLMGWLSPGDAYTQLTWWFKTGESKNKYSNPKVDEAIARTQTAKTADEATAAYKEVQSLVWADIPWLPIYFQPSIYAQSAKLKGTVLSEVPPQMDFTKATLNK